MYLTHEIADRASALSSDKDVKLSTNANNIAPFCPSAGLQQPEGWRTQLISCNGVGIILALCLELSFLTVSNF